MPSSFSDIKIVAEIASVDYGNWNLVQSIDVTESPQFMELEQVGSDKKRRIRLGGSYQCSISQIFNEDDGVWDLSGTFTLKFYHDEIFMFFQNLDVPSDTSYIELTGCSLGDKRMGVSRDGDIIYTQNIIAEGIDWNAVTSGT